MRRARLKRARRARGVAALELALLLPLLVVLPVGAWEWGRALDQHARLAHSVRAAARHLSTVDASDPARQAEARQLAVFGSLSGGTTPVVPGLNASHVKILEPQSEPGLQLVATAGGSVSLVCVSISGWRYEPVLLPASAALTFRPVSLTLVQSFS